MTNYSMFSDEVIEEIANKTAGGLISLSDRKVLNIAYEMEKQGFYFPVVNAQCNYHAPAHYDDFITVETTISELKHVTVTSACFTPSLPPTGSPNHFPVLSANRYNKLYKSKYSTIGWQVETVKDILNKYNATKDIQEVQDSVTKYIKDKEIREIADNIAYDLKLNDLSEQTVLESSSTPKELTSETKKLTLKFKRNKKNNDNNNNN